MLEYNEITPHRYIIIDKQPYEVIDAHVFRKQQRKPVNATKLRNLITGNVKEVSFHVSDKVEEADLQTMPVKYLYTNRGELWFCEKDNPSKRFTIESNLLGNQINFIKTNSLVDALIFNEKIISIKYPIKVELKVVEAPPGVKGDTAKGGSKQIKLETGATINAPLFINEGDIIRVNTETGEYAERA